MGTTLAIVLAKKCTLHNMFSNRQTGQVVTTYLPIRSVCHHDDKTDSRCAQQPAREFQQAEKRDHMMRPFYRPHTALTLACAARVSVKQRSTNCTASSLDIESHRPEWLSS